jgi:iron complex outermembrane recepter protein
VGLFYQRQTQSLDLTQYMPGIEAYLDYIGQPNTSTHGDVIYAFNRNTQFAEKAAFGELTFHLTDRWQLTGGTRFFQQPYSSSLTGILPLYGELGGLENYSSNTSNTYSSHIWKLNSSYDFTSTLKVYATFSEGYRHGGVSGLPSAGAFASPPDLQTFKPDLAKNYELGVKGSLFEHRINYFADIYLVNIYNFQFDALSLSGGAGAFNGQTARSQGLESEAQIAITDHFNAGAGYAFTRSYVTKAFNILDYPPFALIPADGGTGGVAPLFGGPIPEGRQLPGVSRNILNLSGDYTLPVGPVGKLTFHADGSYRSSQTSNINPGYYYFVIPSAFIGNVRVSMNTKENITYSLFVRNVTNNPDISGGLDDQEFGNPYRLRTVGTPRTFGLGVRYKF